METLTRWMVFLLLHGYGSLLDWGVPQLILAVLGVLAARRHKLPGLWWLAVAAVLSLFLKVGLALFIHLDPDRGNAALISRVVNFFASLAILLIAGAGWANLAIPLAEKRDQAVRLLKTKLVWSGRSTVSAMRSAIFNPEFLSLPRWLKRTFHPIPQGRQAWWRVAALPFQAFVILGPFSRVFTRMYADSAYPHREYWFAMPHFSHQLAIGYSICFLALLILGVRQQAAGHPVSAKVDFALAALSVLWIFATPTGWLLAHGAASYR